MQDAPHVARVLHMAEMVEQRGKARPARQDLGGKSHGMAPNQGQRIDSDISRSVI
jgi:hypothetical protein